MLQLLGDMLLDRSNSAVMVRYVTSLDHMRIMMNLLRVLFSPLITNTFFFTKLNCLCLYCMYIYNICFDVIILVHQCAGLKQDNKTGYISCVQGE